MLARNRTPLASLVICAALGAACTDNGLSTGGAILDLAPPPDLAVPADLAIPPDLAIGPDLVVVSTVGRACPMGTECDPGQLCLGPKLNPALPPVGYCTRSCTSDNDCGPGAFCSPPIPNAGSLCFANCGPNDACPQGQVCGHRLSGTFDLLRTACLPGNPNARDGSSCSTFGDCNRNQACLVNPFDNPGGYCITLGCTLGNDLTCSPAPGNDARCADLGGLTGCIDTCKMASDCRQIEKYACLPLGNGLPSVCVLPNAGAGAACAADAQCGPAGTPWRCLTGASFPKGYCGNANCRVGDETTCPQRSHCYDPTPARPGSGDEFCARDCAADADCRVADGYTCQTIGMNLKGCRL